MLLSVYIQQNHIIKSIRLIAFVLDVATRLRSGIVSNQKDDRTRRIEIVRQTEGKPIDMEMNDNQRRSLQILRDKFKQKKRVLVKVESMPTINKKHEHLKH